jgi:hypothetical protein
VLILEEKIHVREILVEVYIRLIKTFLDLLLLELQGKWHLMQLSFLLFI